MQSMANSIPSPRRKRQVFPGLGAWLLWALLVPALTIYGAEDRAARARELKTQLVRQILPYWYDTAVDRQYGGYVLSDNGTRQSAPATEKQLVTQARMIWGFSHAHLKHLGDGTRDYLKAAEQGYRFLLDHFYDGKYGGYSWSTDLAGKPLDQRKIVYGESFVIYGLVEYYRASGDKGALDKAMELFQVLQRRAHDSKYGGWVEHFQRDWTPILDPKAQVMVEVAGCKSANTHLHLMEAFTELYDASRNPAAKKSLAESLKINMTWFYPPDPAKSAFHRQPDWKPVTAASSAGLSYGHNVEFAWLMVRAQKVLNRKPSWAHFDAHLEHALKYGYDHARGGLYSRGFDNRPATDTDKVWWVEAEMMAALTDGLLHRRNDQYGQALDQLLEFILKYQANPADGIWLDTVTAEGKPKVSAKAHNWKANYHDVRAMVKYIEAFGS